MTHSTKLQWVCVLWLGVLLTVAFGARDAWPHWQAGEVQLEAPVVEVHVQNGSAQQVRVQPEGTRGRLQITAPLYPRVRVGDVVRVTCELRPIADVWSESFRYDRYLAKERVYGVCRTYGSLRVVGVERGWRRSLAGLQAGIEAQIQKSVPEPHASLLVGLLYGAQSTLPAEVEESFRRTGTMHIVAVSGFNVMVVGSSVLLLLTVFVCRRQRALVVVLLAIAGFVLLAGADAAVVRAGIMGSLVLWARHVGRPHRMQMLLLLAAVLMATWNPRILLDDVGFQLSFAAAVGLVWISPSMQRFLAFVPPWGGVRATLSETLSAILATLPISAWHFGTVSVVAPIANVLIVPWITWAMGLGVAGVLMASAVPSLGSLATLPATVVLDIMLLLARALAPLPILEWSL